MLHHPFLVALAAVIAVNVIVAIVAIETGIRRGLGVGETWNILFRSWFSRERN
jgi:hypothetical protein